MTKSPFDVLFCRRWPTQKTERDADDKLQEFCSVWDQIAAEVDPNGRSRELLVNILARVREKTRIANSFVDTAQTMMCRALIPANKKNQIIGGQRDIHACRKRSDTVVGQD